MEDINVIGEKKAAIKYSEELENVGEQTIEEYILSCKECANKYRSLIENNNFSLTIDDICDILDVGENYVQRYIIKYLDRLELTKEARTGFKYIKEVNFNRELLIKKILISKDSFLEYLSNNLVKVSDWITFTFDVAEFESLNIDIKSLRSELTSIKNKVHSKFRENVKYKFEPEELKLQSIDNMKIRIGLRHNVQIYRRIQKYSYKKYILNKNSVRYMMNDEDIKKIIIDNKKDVIHTTIDNIEPLNSNDNAEGSEEVVSIRIEKYTLEQLFKSKLEGLELKDMVRCYLIHEIENNAPIVDMT